MRFDVTDVEMLMLGNKPRWIAPLAATAAMLVAASSAGAVDTPPDVLLPAGIACDDFDLGLTADPQGTIKIREFANGNIYQVGTGRSLIWSNEDTGKTYTVKTSGSVSRYIKNSDGTYTLNLTGHNGFVYFPTDRPIEDGGAGAYQYTGRVVLTVDSPITNNVLSVDATAGKAVDICELLK